jgi:protein gp37
MGENSAIEWTDHTFNPWVGCTKISPACDHCYAEGWAKRSGLVTWGGTRRRTSPANWKQPLKWHAAVPDGQRKRVFCASLADVFDNEVPDEWRFDLFELIRQTPRLDWLLLTKRIGNAKRMLMQFGMEGSYNIWIGATVANQEEADRDIPKLIATPARIRFLSIEPLLGPIDFAGRWVEYRNPAIHENVLERVNWVIVGGESGAQARPMNPEWVRTIRDQCKALGTPFFFKQWGEWVPAGEIGFHGHEKAPTQFMEPCHSMMRVGKKTAGRFLDGFTHSVWPRDTVQPSGDA